MRAVARGIGESSDTFLWNSTELSLSLDHLERDRVGQPWGYALFHWMRRGDRAHPECLVENAARSGPGT
jgi:hypothetical protein